MERKSAARDDQQHRDSIRPQHLIDKCIQASSSIDVVAIRQRRRIRAQDLWWHVIATRYHCFSIIASPASSDAISLQLLPHQPSSTPSGGSHETYI
jgi:hypothetical protein